MKLLEILIMVFLTFRNMSAETTPNFILMERVNPLNQGSYVKKGRADPNESLKLTFNLKERNMDKLESFLEQVSNPKSPMYGKHMTKAEIDELTHNPEAFEMMETFLQHTGATAIEEGKRGSRVTAAANVSVWERALHCEFHNYEKEGEAGSLLRTEEYSLPEKLAVHVNSVTPTVQFPVVVHRGGPVMMRKIDLPRPRGEP